MQPESVIQATFVSMFRQLYPKFGLNLSLNGISLDGLNPSQRAKLISVCKQQGMEPGTPDLLVYLPSGKVLNLEFKTQSGKQSPDQVSTQTKLKSLGHNYYLVRDIYEPFKLIAEHTIYADRHQAFESLDISSDGELLTEPFLHYPVSTPKSQVLEELCKLYQITVFAL